MTKSAGFWFPYRQGTYCHADVSLAISGLILNSFLCSEFSAVHFKRTDPFLGTQYMQSNLEGLGRETKKVSILSLKKTITDMHAYIAVIYDRLSE